MKVLQVNCVYGEGSTGKIVAELHKQLLDAGIESVVCYGRGKKNTQEGIYRTCGEFYSKINHFIAKLRGQLYGGCHYSTRRLCSIIKREKPDVVHLQCINGFFVNIWSLLAWLKKNNIKTVLTLHAEFMYTANCGHARDCERWKTGCGNCPQLKTDIRSFGIDGTSSSWKKMKRAFDGFTHNMTIVSVSPWLMMRAKQSPFLADKEHCVVMNGLDTEVFCRRNTESLRQCYQEDKKLVLFATTCLTNSPDDLKGGRYIIELAKRVEQDNIIILVAGNYEENLDLPTNMILLGRIGSQDLLAQYYSMVDLTVLASLRETFSMVTAESLCCGTPVVGFEAGGPETIAIPEYSCFVSQGDVDALTEAVRKMLQENFERMELGKKAVNVYSGDSMVKGYMEVYRSIMEK